MGLCTVSKPDLFPSLGQLLSVVGLFSCNILDIESRRFSEGPGESLSILKHCQHFMLYGTCTLMLVFRGLVFVLSLIESLVVRTPPGSGVSDTC